MKKVSWVFILITVLMLIGCTPQEEPVSEGMQSRVDYRALSQDELNMRVALESVYIEDALNPQHTNNDDESIEQYGVTGLRWQENRIAFDCLDDMETVFSNKDFQRDFLERYHLNVPQRYYLHKDLADTYGVFFGIVLVVVDGEYYLSIRAFEKIDDAVIQWGVFDNQTARSAKEIIDFYAKLDGLTVNSIVADNGTTVYYLTGSNCSLYHAAGLPLWDKLTTCYIWDQDGVIGTVVVAGEHKPENLDLCVLEHREL